jgi:hypothetical protein
MLSPKYKTKQKQPGKGKIPKEVYRGGESCWAQRVSTQQSGTLERKDKV